MSDELEERPRDAASTSDEPHEVVDGVLSEDEIRHFVRSEVNQTISHHFTASVSTSPIPAEALLRINEVHPGAIEWTLAYMDKEQAFRHRITERGADYDFKQLEEETKGKMEGRRIMGAVIVLVLAAAVALGVTGHSVESLTTVIVALATLTGVYIYGPLRGRQQNSEIEETDGPDASVESTQDED